MYPRRIGKIFILIYSLVFPASIVLAADPPSLLSPQNNSTTTSSKMEWQQPSYALYSSNPYRVQVDNNADISSPEKDYYTQNLNYTPSLDLGEWYWRIKVKDSSASWSEWSSIWKFNLSSATSPPSPTSSPTPNETPTNSSSVSSFTLSSSTSKIDSNQSFSPTISLTGLTANTKYYLKGAFYKEGSTNYFGKTKVSGEWVKNSSSYVSQFSFTTDSVGNFSGTIEVMTDINDSGFTGGGSYRFKVGRYNSSGAGPTWSNDKTVEISLVIASPSSTSTVSPTPTPKISPTPSPKSVLGTSTSSAQNKTSEETINYPIPDIKGESTTDTPASPPLQIKSNKKVNWFFILGGLVVFITGGGVIVIKYPDIVKKLPIR